MKCSRNDLNEELSVWITFHSNFNAHVSLAMHRKACGYETEEREMKGRRAMLNALLIKWQCSYTDVMQNMIGADIGNIAHSRYVLIFGRHYPFCCSHNFYFEPQLSHTLSNVCFYKKSWFIVANSFNCSLKVGIDRVFI